ncbi:hypothetical protein [Nocardioides sp.]|uniref:hypothetical protein n=1 Tax=Nocardioides sp. TaxID=35761 RepID=UPI003D14A5A3
MLGIGRDDAPTTRRRRTTVWTALASIFAALLLTGSSCLGVDRTNDILSDAVLMLEQESASWEQVLQDTRDKLVAEGKKTLAVQVDKLLKDTMQNVGIEARCYTDFLRDRVANDLKRLLARQNDDEPPNDPRFCNPSPDSIDLNLLPSERRLIRVDGFNLSRSMVTARVETTPGAFVDVSDYVDDPSSYLVTLNLAAIEQDQPQLLPSARRVVFALGADPATATENSVTILPKTPDPVPIYAKTLVTISGKVHLHDYDPESANEDRDVYVNQTLIVRSGAVTPATWSFSNCVDHEVQGDLWVQFSLNQSTGVVDAVGTAYYWEGSSCADKVHVSQPLAFTLTPTVDRPSYPFSTPLADGDGGIYPSLLFTYHDPIIVLPGEPVPLYPAERLHR